MAKSSQILPKFHEKLTTNECLNANNFIEKIIVSIHVDNTFNSNRFKCGKGVRDVKETYNKYEMQPN